MYVTGCLPVTSFINQYGEISCLLFIWWYISEPWGDTSTPVPAATGKSADKAGGRQLYGST